MNVAASDTQSQHPNRICTYSDWTKETHLVAWTPYPTIKEARAAFQQKIDRHITEQDIVGIYQLVINNNAVACLRTKCNRIDRLQD